MNSRSTKLSTPASKPASTGQSKQARKRARKRASLAAIGESMRSVVKAGPMAGVPVSMQYLSPNVWMRSERPTRPGASVRIVGCDYVGQVSSSAAGFADTVYQIDANSATTFPRLSSIAKVFELYAFNRLEAAVVGIAPSTQPGAQTAVFQYDAGAATSFTAAQIRNEEKSVTKKFWEDFKVQADCKRAARPWFVNDTVSGGENNDQVFAQLHLGTDQTATAIPVADLFICYDVEFAQGQATTAPELTRLLPFLRKEGAVEAMYRLAEAHGIALAKPKSGPLHVVMDDRPDPDVVRVLASLQTPKLESCALPPRR